jgi:hypothetical protein
MLRRGTEELGGLTESNGSLFRSRCINKSNKVFDAKKGRLAKTVVGGSNPSPGTTFKDLATQLPPDPPCFR